jgi:hypothetical protein
MKEYIGVKVIQAEPMTKYDFYLNVKGVVCNEDNEHGYKVVYQDGYVSWSPKVVFEEAYRETSDTTGLTFGLAVEAMKQGFKVARQGWNGKGMWLALSKAPFKDLHWENFWCKHAQDFALANGGSAEVLPTIIMKTADNKILMGWLASQTDMLAEDWIIVE